MPWVAEIQEHRDYFKNPSTKTATFLAETKEEAKKMAVLCAMEHLDEQNYFRAFTPDGEDSHEGVTEEMKKAMLSRDANQIFKVLYENEEAIFKGEYVPLTFEMQVYERSEEYDKFDDDAFLKICDAARDAIDCDGEIVPFFEGEMERLYPGMADDD
jgi:hypothetical protein